jgi:HAD superfamily phosphatase
MYTIEKAKALYPERRWIGVGILPPHVQETGERRTAYEEILKEAGAVVVFSNVEQLSVDQIQRLVINSSHA